MIFWILSSPDVFLLKTVLQKPNTCVASVNKSVSELSKYDTM